MLLVRDEDYIKSFRKAEKVCRSQEMTGLSSPGLLSCFQGPALLVPVPTVVWYFFLISPVMRAQEKRNLGLVGQ